MEIDHPLPTEVSITDFAETVLGADPSVTGVLTFSELLREIACEDGTKLVGGRQVQRRLHLEVSTADMDRPSSGKVVLNGKTCDCHPKTLKQIFAKEISFVFQSGNLISDLTAFENVAFPGYLIDKKSNITAYIWRKRAQVHRRIPTGVLFLLALSRMK